MKIFFRFVSSFTLFLPAALALSVLPASAASYIVNSNGELIGAHGVEVRDKRYIVSFGVPGTCADLYTGCDSVSDFPFGGNAELAALAATALAEQVFGNDDVFDREPKKTKGCYDMYPVECEFFFPWEIVEDFPDTLIHAGVVNFPDAQKDIVSTSLLDDRGFPGNSGVRSYVTWTVIPIPATFWLFASALLGFIGLSRRKATAILG